MNTTQRQLMCLLLAGFPTSRCAETLGLSSSSIQAIKGTEMFRTELSRLEAQIMTEQIEKLKEDGLISKARAVLEEAAEGAASQMVSLSSGARSETVRLSASSQVLDRAGLSPLAASQRKLDDEENKRPIQINLPLSLCSVLGIAPPLEVEVLSVPDKVGERTI